MAWNTDYGCDPRGNHNRTYLKTHTCRIESMHGKHTLGPNQSPKTDPGTRGHMVSVKGAEAVRERTVQTASDARTPCARAIPEALTSRLPAQPALTERNTCTMYKTTSV